jgi:hypothetical protein
LRAIAIGQTQKGFIGRFPNAQDGFTVLVEIRTYVDEFFGKWRTDGENPWGNSEVELEFRRKVGQKSNRSGGRNRARNSRKREVGMHD